MNQAFQEIRPSHGDRSTALAVFGSLTVLLGFAFGLLIPMAIVSRAFREEGLHGWPSLLFAVVVYGGFGGGLVWLGIGSILARRWARALLLIFSWCWLIAGIYCAVCMAFCLPKVLAITAGAGAHLGPSDHLMRVISWDTLLFGWLFVVMPAVWTFFYGSSHVQATCEERDPRPAWTDRCPLPVLGMCVVSACWVPVLLLSAAIGPRVFTFFGRFLTGLPAVGVQLCVAAVWASAAWALYRLRSWGWWLIFLGSCAISISAFLTFTQSDVAELCRLLNYTQEEVQAMEESGFLTGAGIGLLLAATFLPFLAYLLFIKRYFRRPVSL